MVIVYDCFVLKNLPTPLLPLTPTPFKVVNNIRHLLGKLKKKSAYILDIYPPTPKMRIFHFSN